MKIRQRYIASFSIIVVLLFVFGACQKHTLNEVLPVVQMTSVVKLGNDSVVVTGTVVTDNGGALGYEGFCYGTNPLPDITQNQKLFQTDSVHFSVHLYVNKDSTYYFRCFAANSFGYGVSGAMK